MPTALGFRRVDGCFRALEQARAGFAEHEDLVVSIDVRLAVFYLSGAIVLDTCRSINTQKPWCERVLLVRAIRSNTRYGLSEAKRARRKFSINGIKVVMTHTRNLSMSMYGRQLFIAVSRFSASALFCAGTIGGGRCCYCTPCCCSCA